VAYSSETQRVLTQALPDAAQQASPAPVGFSGPVGMPFDSGLLLELAAQDAALKEGRPECTTEILAAQVETLSAMFYGLVDSVDAYRADPYQQEKLRLALRVQGRLVATAQAIVEMKKCRVPRSIVLK
jgi:hypothetical protein